MTGPIKLIAAVAGSTILGWVNVVAQSDVPGSAGSSSVVISGVAASAASAALAYVVRQLASGNLVHRSAADLEDRLQKLADRVTDIASEGQKRETVYVQMLVGKAVPKNPGKE